MSHPYLYFVNLLFISDTMLDPFILFAALLLGLLFKAIGQPALIGYLLAGFVVHALKLEHSGAIHTLAELGEILLLFTIGLKLRFKSIKAPYVWGVSLLHMALILPIFTLIIHTCLILIDGLPPLTTEGAWLLAFALAFSSTIFAVKIFDEKGEGNSIFATISIGILVVQDLVAVLYMSSTSDTLPSLYSPLLLLLIPLRPVIDRFLRFCGHGELLILAGFCIALSATTLFEHLGLKADLGALLAGCLLANTSKSKELYSNLMNFKDLFLIGFFLSIGLYGLPSTPLSIFAAVLVVAMLMKPILFYFLLTCMRLRSRTALLTSLSLANYSEFGLIVVSLAVSQGLLDAQWLVMLAVALSLSFLVASPFNKSAHLIFARFQTFFCTMERPRRLDIEQPAQIGHSQVLILGMGRVGKGVYDHLYESNYTSIVGIEESSEKTKTLKNAGYHIIQADGNDGQFWQHLDLSYVELIMINLTNHEENRSVVELIKKTSYDGPIASMARFQDQKDELEKMGCIAFNLYGEAGHGFAEHVLSNIKTNSKV